MRRAVPLVVLMAIWPLLAAASHVDLWREAIAAYNRKEYAAARESLAAALKLRPDSPRYLQQLAATAALTGDKAGALRLLQQLVDLGVAPPLERDPGFASLQGEPEFLRIVQRLAENRRPQGEAAVLAELPGRTGIIEGIAFRPRTGDLFLGDVHLRCIWRRDRTGQVSRFSAEDEELLGIFGIAIDERHNALWAAMAAIPEMSGFESDLKGQAALAEFNLATSELRRVVPVPGDGRDHGLGDLTVAEDGTVYATDSLAPIIWQLGPGDEEMVKFVESPQFVSLQGLVLSERVLMVADYGNGLFAIDRSAGEHGRSAETSIRAFAPPENTTLLGLDGLLAVPGGIIAVQNGITPARVVHLALSPDLQTVTALTVLASSLPNLEDISLVTQMNDGAAFIAGAGWDGYDASKMTRPPAHTVRILQVVPPGETSPPR